MQLIPAIDLIGGRCVRLEQGDFARATHYAPTPQALLRRYESLGAAWVHVVDLDGARAGERANHAVIAALATVATARLQVGGGVRSAAALEVLFACGVARVVLGSVALEAPAEVLGWLGHYGAERLCLAFDLRCDRAGQTRVHTHGWSRSAPLSLWEALAPYRGRARHVLCTDIGRDGTLAGPNLALYQEALRRYPQFAWQASGGVRDAADLAALAASGVAAAVSGKALLEEHLTATELRPFLPDASLPASTSATAAS